MTLENWVHSYIFLINPMPPAIHEKVYRVVCWRKEIKAIVYPVIPTTQKTSAVYIRCNGLR